jgi:class 3 adenylate cyclase
MRILKIENTRDGVALLAIALVAAIISYLSLSTLPFLGNTERYVADYRIATLTPTEQPHPDIVFVAITEDTLAQFPYRSPVDRKFISDTLKLLESRGARAVFIDVLLDTPTEEDKDDELMETLRAVKIPVVVSYEDQLGFLNEEQLEYLNNFLPKELRAFANLSKDLNDQTVRKIFPGKNSREGEWKWGVASKMVEHLGVSPPRVETPMAYRGPPGFGQSAFRKFPAHALPVLPPEWVKDKVIVFGADVTDRDRYRTPFSIGRDGVDSLMPGAEILAHQMAQLLDGRKSPAVAEHWAILLVVVSGICGVLLGKMEIKLVWGVLIGTTLILTLWIGGFAWYHYLGDLLPLVMPSVALVLALGITNAYSGRQERQQKKFIQNAFSKYLSPALLDEIVKDPAKLNLEARRKELSLIFTDVAGFTSMAEKMDPAKVGEVLNRYLHGVCGIIFTHGGTVDKFIGDAVFAIFNAPRDQEDHSQRAVACALAIDAFSDNFLKEELASGGLFGLTRIGVHTGEANIGNFGSAERFEYTALGDAVNTASRLEGVNKAFGTRVCVSINAASRCPEIAFRPVGDIILKGKTEPLRLMEPLDEARAKTDHTRAYMAAYALLEQEDPQAAQAWEDLYQMDPSDQLVAWRLEEIRSGNYATQVEMHEK